MMFTKAQYFGEHAHTEVHSGNADTLIKRITPLFDKLQARKLHFRINPKTGSIISGSTLGGFRPQDCAIGAPKSQHKLGLAVDIYDPDNAIDSYLMDNQQLLKEFYIYIEHPDKTPGWSHWQVLPPKSNKFVFMP